MTQKILKSRPKAEVKARPPLKRDTLCRSRLRPANRSRGPGCSDSSGPYPIQILPPSWALCSSQQPIRILHHEDSVFKIKLESGFSYHRGHRGYGEEKSPCPFLSWDCVEALKDHPGCPKSTSSKPKKNSVCSVSSVVKKSRSIHPTKATNTKSARWPFFLFRLLVEPFSMPVQSSCPEYKRHGPFSGPLTPNAPALVGILFSGKIYVSLKTARTITIGWASHHKLGPEPNSQFRYDRASNIKRGESMKGKKTTPPRGWWGVILLGLVTIIFGAVRLAMVNSSLSEESVPSGLFDRRYVENPILAHVHILAGSLLFVVGPLQFLPAVRRRWLWLHRLLGRIFIILGGFAGVSAIYMVYRLPAFGGLATASATLFFGTFFLIALGKALYHVRRKEIALHRQWMIRAFSTALAVSTIRLYILFFQLFSDYSMAESFGVTFWLAFCTHACLAEWWIRSTQRLSPDRSR